MTGGLLQLVATGLDNIFLTSNPSITLFKLTYRRHTNFSVTQRTQQILNVDFGQNGQYELQKEGDIIHNMYLNINISDFKLQYPLPTITNIQDLLNKYNLDIILDNNTSITIDYYNNIIIPQIINNLSKLVNEFNFNKYFISNEYNFFFKYDTTNINLNKILQDNYNYLISKNIQDNLDINILFLILKSYLNDIMTNNTNNIVYNSSDIYNALLNDILYKLTYIIIGFDVNNNLEDEFYDSLKLLYIIDNNIDNIQNYSTTNILNFISNIIQTSNIPILKIQDFNKLENFITLQKIINMNNITSKNINNLTHIIKKNMYYNNDIIYNVIINTLLKYTHNTSHYICGIYKTFTNNISDSNNFASSIQNLSDNLISIFNNYNNAYNINNDIYLLTNIINILNNFNMNNREIFNQPIFNDYFNDYTIWENINILSPQIQNIYSNLYLNLTSGTVINTNYYYDNVNNKFISRPQNNNDPNYIDIIQNIFNKYFRAYVNSNLYIFNLIPFIVINKIAIEIFTEFNDDNYINSNIDISLYDYRDLQEITNFASYNQINLYNNQIIKNKLYKELLLNILLQINNTSSDFILSDSNFITQFSNTYTNVTRQALIFLFRQENLFDLNINDKLIKLPPINYIQEIFRINILKNINNTHYEYVFTKLDNILNRYNKFKNSNNLSNSDYSYNAYILNGLSFKNIETNTIHQPVTNMIHAQSSIYAYCYNIFIQNYNTLFNNTLISIDFYKNNIGNHYQYTYNDIKSSLINLNQNYFNDISFNTLKKYYSYELNNHNIYFFDESINYNYPIINTGFDYFSIGDNIIFNNGNITYNTINYTLISNQSQLPTLQNLNANKNLINNLQNLTYLDYKYLYTNLKLFYNIHTDTIDLTKNFINSPYTSNLFNVSNNMNNIMSINNLIEIINSINLSQPESNILTYSLNDLKNYYMLGDVLINIKKFILKYKENNNPFDNQFISSYDSYNYIEALNYNITNSIIFTDGFFQELINNINSDIYKTSLYNNYKNISDVINYLINKIIQLSNYKFIYDNIDLNINDYIHNLINKLSDTNNGLLTKILNLVVITNDNKIIDTSTDFIKFNENIPYIEYLYVNKDAFIDISDILYHGSTLDILLRNMIEQNPVKTCWVPELGYYLLENISLHFDQLLIDEYDSNLLSLLKKINIPYDQYNGLDKLIGNIPNLITYDTMSKGNLHLYVPLNFYFCKNAAISLPMINMLYTKGTIQFKIRNLNDVLIYDPNAIFIKKPIIKCNMLVKYIYLEEGERKKVSSSKIEFLIEKYKNAGIFYYSVYDLLGNKTICECSNLYPETKIISRLRMVDPTKYILWRLRVKYKDINMNNYFWNNDGYIYNDKQIKTISYIKILFNSKIREQGQPQLFNLINPYGRYVGSLKSDEYLYSFSLFPLVYQPSGSANLSHIEDIMIEHTLEPEFIKLIKQNNLVIEMEYWSCSYNILRMISGLCAPLFYN